MSKLSGPNDLIFQIIHKLENLLTEISKTYIVGLGSSVGCASDWYRQHSFVEVDHEIFSTVILSLPLIQGRQLLSVSGERMCTILVNRLED